MIYIASDHGGFKLKNFIFKFLKEKNIEVEDLGPNAFKDEDDYPDYMIPAIEKVLENPTNRGILICRNGAGASILANKFKGIRCVLSWREQHAKTSRFDDDTNILALPADYISGETACSVVEDWLKTDFSGEERHIRRLEKIKAIEK